MSRRGLNYTISLTDSGFASQLEAERRRVTALTAEVERLNRTINSRPDPANGLGNSSSGRGLGVGSLVRGNLMSGAITAGLGMIKTYGVEVAMTTAKIQGYENAIRFASGSSYEGGKNIEFLKDQSDRLGVSLESSYKGFKTFSGAMMGSRFSSEQVRQMFNDVQVANSAMNLTAEDSEGVYLALGQIMSKGKVQAEELRGQIGERIPGAFNIAARAMGMSTEKLDKLMEKGEILASDFLPKFTAELQKTFQGALPSSMQSLQSAFNRAENSTLSLKTTLGSALEPVIKEGTESWITFADSLSRAIAGQTPMADKTRELKIQLNAEMEVLKDGNITMDQRKTLIEKINAAASPYLQNLLTEKSTIEDITKAQNELNAALNKKIAIQVKNEVLAEMTRKIVENDKYILDAQIEKEKTKLEGGSKNDVETYDRKILAAKMYKDDLLKEYGNKNKILSKTLTDLGVTSGDINTLVGGGAPLGPPKPTNLTGGDGSKSTTSTSVASGRSVRNVTVHINKLVENLNIENHSDKLADNKTVRRNVSEGMVRVITDFEQIAE